MLNFKLPNLPKNWFWIHPQSYKQSNVAINQYEPELEPDLAAKRKMALQVEADLRRIKEKVYLLRPNVF